MPKTNKTAYYENYPYWIISVSNLLSVAIYAISAFIIYKLGVIWLVLYLLYILGLEIRLLKWHCVNCYYYGRLCAFGKGKISCLLFKQGSPKKFCEKKITWKDMIPDLMVSLIPIIIGIALLIIKFDWLIFASLVVLFLLSFVGNAFVRSSLACKYCRQRKIGCPAEQLFSKKKS